MNRLKLLALLLLLLFIGTTANAVAPYPFCSGPVSPPLNFTNGQVVHVTGKCFKTGGITMSGVVSPSIQNNDFLDGFGIVCTNCSGVSTIAHNRFRNPPTNAIKIVNSFFGANSTIIHNSFRGSKSVIDYILMQNSGGLVTATPWQIEYNHCDGRDPDTGVILYGATGGSCIHYGGVTTTGAGNTSLVYNTMYSPQQFGIHVDSGANIILYYNIITSAQTPNSIAAMKFMAAPGTIGNGGVPLEVSVDDSEWLNSAGVSTQYYTDGSLMEKYLSEVNVLVDLNNNLQ